jgi:hypothetical protein
MGQAPFVIADRTIQDLGEIRVLRTAERETIARSFSEGKPTSSLHRQFRWLDHIILEVKEPLPDLFPGVKPMVTGASDTFETLLMKIGPGTASARGQAPARLLRPIFDSDFPPAHTAEDILKFLIDRRAYTNPVLTKLYLVAMGADVLKAETVANNIIGLSLNPLEVAAISAWSLSDPFFAFLDVSPENISRIVTLESPDLVEPGMESQIQQFGFLYSITSRVPSYITIRPKPSFRDWVQSQVVLPLKRLGSEPLFV